LLNDTKTSFYAQKIYRGSTIDLCIKTTRNQSRSLIAKKWKKKKHYFLLKIEKTDIHLNMNDSHRHSPTRKKLTSKFKHMEPEMYGMECAKE
jgi:hypothetical protein